MPHSLCGTLGLVPAVVRAHAKAAEWLAAGKLKAGLVRDVGGLAAVPVRLQEHKAGLVLGKKLVV